MEELSLTDVYETYFFINMNLKITKSNIKTNLRLIKNYLELCLQRLFKRLFQRYSYPLINIVVENANWSIKWDGFYLKESLTKYLNKDILDVAKFTN